MLLKDFYYDLPKELIAQDPLEDRASSRLMVVDKNTGKLRHETFRNVINYLKPGDCMVINDTKVIPARLSGPGRIPERRLKSCSLQESLTMCGSAW